MRILADPEALARAGAAEIVGAYTRAMARRGRFDLVLAGGSTPRGTYEVLAEEPFRGAVDWARVRVFWGDERCVPPTHAQSNFRMAADTLLSRVPIPEASIHRISGELPAARAAALYEQVLRSAVPEMPPRFDLVLLGLGTDGHVASLFPGADGPDDSAIAIPTSAPAEPRERVSLTLPVLNAAREILFLVSGMDKADVLSRVFAERADRSPAVLPAARVRPTRGRVRWLVDRAAAPGALEEPAPSL